MSGFDIIILIIAIAIIAAVVGAFVTSGQKSLKEMTEDFHNNEEAQEIVELTQELYNKDLRPIVAKKAPKTKETKSEFPIEQPAKKKRKYYPRKKKQGDN
jgi:hypothetical protein